METGFSYGVRCLVSAIVVSASIAYVVSGVLSGEHRFGISWILHVVLLISVIAFLAYFESGQVAIVNLSSIDEKQSKNIQTTHTRAYNVYTTISKAGTVERYLMGRQLCVIGLVFVIAQLTFFPSMDPIFPPMFEKILIRSGLPGVMITLTIAQLFPQLLADEYTIRFLNSRGSLLFIKIATAFESVGILTHFSWITSYVLVHWVFQWKEKPETVTNNPLDSLDISRSTHALIWGTRTPSNSVGELEISSTFPSSAEVAPLPPSALEKDDVSLQKVQELNPMKSGIVTSFTTLFKLLLSSGLTLLAAAIIVYGVLFATPMLKLHPALLLLLLVTCVVVEFYLEGSQVAILAAQRRDIKTIPPEFSNAIRVLQVASADKDVVKRFLIGRQFLVVMSMFTMASITTYQHYHDYEQGILPKKVFGTFVLTGFSGVLFALNTVQLPAQIIAQQYPVRFLNFPGSILLIRAALAVEYTGIMHFGWILFHIIGKLLYLSGE